MARLPGTPDIPPDTGQIRERIGQIHGTVDALRERFDEFKTAADRREETSARREERLTNDIQSLRQEQYHDALTIKASLDQLKEQIQDLVQLKDPVEELKKWKDNVVRWWAVGGSIFFIITYLVGDVIKTFFQHLIGLK
jgi:hypothetical protein